MTEIEKERKDLVEALDADLEKLTEKYKRFFDEGFPLGDLDFVYTFIRKSTEGFLKNTKKDKGLIIKILVTSICALYKTNNVLFFLMDKQKGNTHVITGPDGPAIISGLSQNSETDSEISKIIMGAAALIKNRQEKDSVPTETKMSNFVEKMHSMFKKYDTVDPNKLSKRISQDELMALVGSMADCELSDKSPAELIKKEILKMQLQKAIADEDYEKADQIKKQINDEL